MAFEGLICPACTNSLDEQAMRDGNLICQHCKTNLKQKKYLAFLEYLMMVGILPNVDFFDKTLYGDEIEHKTVEEKELEDYTNPGDYEDATEKFKHFVETIDLKETTTEEEEFRKWDGIEEDWEDFNKNKEKKK